MTAALCPYDIIFLNGPPYSGKDTAARGIANRLGVRTMKANQPAIDAVCEILGIGPETLEAAKREPIGRFMPTVRNDYRVRDMLIDFWQAWMKPTHGVDVAGRILGRRMAQAQGHREDDTARPGFVISDSGFTDEVIACLHETNRVRRWATHALLVHIQRPGTTFEGDSRHWVSGRSFIDYCAREGIKGHYGVLVNDGDDPEAFAREAALLPWRVFNNPESFTCAL